MIARVVNERHRTSSLLWEQGDLLLHNLFDNGDDGRSLPRGTLADIVYENDINIGNVDDLHLEDDDTMTINESSSEVVMPPSSSNHNDDDAIPLQRLAINNIQESLISYDNPILSGGRPYDWCQYLAGLNHPQPVGNNIVSSSSSSSSNNNNNHNHNLKYQQMMLTRDLSTKTFLQQLTRRIISHTTLAKLIRKLCKLPNPVPIYSAVENTMKRLNADSQNSDEMYAYSSIDTKLTKLVEFIIDR